MRLIYASYKRTSEPGAATKSYRILANGVEAGDAHRIARRWWIASNAEGDGACRAKTRREAVVLLLTRRFQRLEGEWQHYGFFA